MYLFLLILILALFGWVAVKDRPLAITLLAAALPSYLLRFQIGPIPFTLLEGLILVLTAVWIVRGEWKQVREIPRAWLFVAGAMLIAAAVATFVNPDHRTSLGILKAYFVEPILLFLIVVTTVKKTEQKKNILLGFGLSAAAVSLFGLFQFLTGAGLPVPWDLTRRVTGPFSYPNALGLYAGPAAVVAAFYLFDLFKRGAKFSSQFILWTIVFVMCVMGIGLAHSEGSAVALAATLFLASLMIPKIRRITLPTAIIILALVLLITPARQAVVKNLSFGDYSGQVRVSQWEETWNMLRAHPIFGAGLSGYPQALIPYHTHTQYEIFQYPHTLLFNIWSELGLLGLGAFVALAWVTASAVRATLPLPKGESEGVAAAASRLVAFACFAALLETCIHGLADVPYFKNDLSALTWLLLALICTSSTYGSRHRSV